MREVAFLVHLEDSASIDRFLPLNGHCGTKDVNSASSVERGAAGRTHCFFKISPQGCVSVRWKFGAFVCVAFTPERYTMSAITLTSAVRQNLVSLQSTADLL